MGLISIVDKNYFVFYLHCGQKLFLPDFHVYILTCTVACFTSSSPCRRGLSSCPCRGRWAPPSGSRGARRRACAVAWPRGALGRPARRGLARCSLKATRLWRWNFGGRSFLDTPWVEGATNWCSINFALLIDIGIAVCDNRHSRSHKYIWSISLCYYQDYYCLDRFYRVCVTPLRRQLATHCRHYFLPLDDDRESLIAAKKYLASLGKS